MKSALSLLIFLVLISSVKPQQIGIPETLNFNFSEEIKTQLVSSLNQLLAEKNLKGSGLVDNQLTGEIPDFSNTPALNFIHATNNQLSGQIPNFTNIPFLNRLWLGNNELTGNIPTFEHVPNLERVRLFGNNLEGDIHNFDNLSNIIEFQIDSNQFIFLFPN